MRFLSLVLILIVATAMASASDKDQPRQYDLSEARSHFDAFKTKFNREYKDAADEEVHYKAFVANLEKINKLNVDNPSATYGINKFADYTEEERKSMFGLRNQ